MVAAQDGPDLTAVEVPEPELPTDEDSAAELSVEEVPDSSLQIFPQRRSGRW